jgi:membrane protease YdiL (CAAX protease family)
MNIPAWQPEYLESILAIAFITFGFSVYHFVSISPKVKLRFSTKYGEMEGLTRSIYFKRYFGAFSIGFIPLIVMLLLFDKDLADYGLTFQNGMLSLYWILGLSTIIIIGNYLLSGKEKNLAINPEIRETEWTKKMVLKSVATLSFYLLGYEVMFRGILLFATAQLFGEWPAIATNVAIYILVHVPKNLEESIGSIPMGIILCLITLTTGTIWVAFFVHIALGVSNLLFSLKNHPDMKLV